MFYIYERQIRPKTDYCYHIWTPDASPYFPVFIEFKTLSVSLRVMNNFSSCNHFSHRWNVTSFSLIYRYFHGKSSCNTPVNIYSDGLHSLVPSALTFIVKTRHAIQTSLIPFMFHWWDVSAIRADSSNEELLCGIVSDY